MDRSPVAAIMFADCGRAADLAQFLEPAGLKSRVIASTDALHQVLNEDCVDLVIIEDQLRGFLSGLEVLERMHSHLLRPSAILIAKATADVERRSRRLGIDCILAPDTSLDDLATMAQETLRKSVQQRVAIPAIARQLVQEANFVKPLPQLLVQLSDCLDGKEPDLKQLAKDISVDAQIASDVLRVTNSSAMGRPFKTTSIFDAVEFLGARRTVAIALATGIRGAQTPMLKVVSPRLRTWYNYRSVLIGSTAAAFAALEKAPAPTAYLLGLLQDIGCLILGQAFGQRYDSLLQRTQSIQHLCLERSELDEFETSHPEVSAALLYKWEMPPSLISIVFRHHAVDWRNCSALDQSMIRIMRIGECFANLSDCRLPKRHMQLNQALAEYGKERADECRQALAIAVAQTVESSKLFSIPVPDEQTLAKLLADTSESFLSMEEMPKPAALEEIAVAEGTHELASRPADAGPTDFGNERLPRLLVIDDDQTTLQLVRWMASYLPVECVECSALEEAERQMQAVSIVVCDVNVGNEAAHGIVQKFRRWCPDVKIVMMSIDNSRENVRSCIDLGIDGFLAKPFSRETFLNAVSRLVPRESVAAVGNEVYEWL